MRMIFTLVIISLLTGSCSKILLPYHEEPLCSKKDGVGFCGSLSEIYEDMEKHPEKYGIGGDEE